MADHAYSVFDTKEFNNCKYLLMWNPWGNGQGPYKEHPRWSNSGFLLRS